MSTATIVISAFLVTGILLIIGAIRADNRSSFEDGSFLAQLLMGIVGLAFVAGSIIAVLVKALVA